MNSPEVKCKQPGCFESDKDQSFLLDAMGKPVNWNTGLAVFLKIMMSF
jgi:hypothetical protein